ncbi:alpha/beta hydrolase [Actinomadura decatromicini]|uniref:Alpha/beta hydrolase n=2 Tax=Actinomadura decatromicini TaxID=2604572 RepID=A0A5D3G0B9_9ACTN|nr:alpha/beta hydrolase [Actinomadura decatromicini]
MRRYRRMSREAVVGLPGRSVVYDRERLDVWGAAPGEARPVFVFLHGGYWMALSRHDSAFMARSLNDRGIATVVPDYTLAPEATLEEIVRQVRASIAWIHREGGAFGLDPGRIVVGGSSAGGHLTGMLMVDGWQREFGVPDDVVKAAMPFSGLFDIRPITRTYVNDTIRLDLAGAAALSPLLLPAGRRFPVVLVVAGHDGSGFVEQSRRFQDHWGPAAELMVVPDRDHFDVVLDLAASDTAVSRALIKLIRSV